MQHLKHTKTDRVHNLEFSGKFNPMNSNFIVETEFQATALYEVGDTFTVNGTKFNATLNPNVYGLFMVNDMVHCVVDFYRKNLKQNITIPSHISWTYPLLCSQWNETGTYVPSSSLLKAS